MTHAQRKNPAGKRGLIDREGCGNFDCTRVLPTLMPREQCNCITYSIQEYSPRIKVQGRVMSALARKHGYSCQAYEGPHRALSA